MVLMQSFLRQAATEERQFHKHSYSFLTVLTMRSLPSLINVSGVGAGFRFSSGKYQAKFSYFDAHINPTLRPVENQYAVRLRR